MVKPAEPTTFLVSIDEIEQYLTIRYETPSTYRSSVFRNYCFTHHAEGADKRQIAPRPIVVRSVGHIAETQAEEGHLQFIEDHLSMLFNQVPRHVMFWTITFEGILVTVGRTVDATQIHEQLIYEIGMGVVTAERFQHSARYLT